jgi:hypothetical protein
MADEAPLSSSRHVATAAVSGGADANTPVFVAPFPATVTSVQYVTPSAITGADTNSRTVSLINKGAAGSGSTAVATFQFNERRERGCGRREGVTLSGTPANVVLASGDVTVIWNSTARGDRYHGPGWLSSSVTLTRGTDPSLLRVPVGRRP